MRTFSSGSHRHLITGAMLLATAGAILFSSPAPASAEPLQLRFDVHVSGLRVMKVKFDGDISDKSYSGAASMRPKGFAKFFLKNRMDMRVKGRFNDRHAAPVSFSIHTMKKQREKSATVKWNGGLVPASFTRKPPAGAQRAQQVRAAIAKGAIDPLSLLFSIARSNAANPCGGKRRVFDGLTVYDMRLTRVGRENIHNMNYSGPALKCRLVYVPVAGMSEKKKRKRLKNPPVFTVWLARVKSTEAGPIYVPVQAAGRLKGRPFTATLVDAALSGRPLRAAAN